MTENPLAKILKMTQKAIGDDPSMALHAAGDPHIASYVPYGIPSGIPELDFHLGGKAGLPAGKIIEYFGFEHSGKAQPLTSRVLTPKGWRTMGSLNPGDEVCTPDGAVAVIADTFPQGVRPVFKLILADGREVRADKDHLWKVYSPAWNRRGLDGYKILTTQEILELKKGRSHNFKVYLPLTSPVYGSELELPIHPYVLGALLGDGSFRCKGVQFTCADPQLVQELNQHIDPPYSFKPYYGLQYYLTKDSSAGGNTYIAKLKLMNLWGLYSHEKFIPNDYLFAPADQRWLLLQGLMDTDGSTGPLGSQFSTSSPQLAKDVQQLVWSLGGRATIHKAKRENRKSEYIVNIVILEREKVVKVKQGFPRKRIWHATNEIKTILHDGQEETKCIRINSKDHLYLTDDYVVTHNTGAAMQAMREVQKMGGIILFVDAEKSWDDNRALQMGLDLDRIQVADAYTIEAMFNVAEKWLETIHGMNIDCPILIVFDSITGVTTEHDQQQGITAEARIGQDARQIRRGVRRFQGFLSKTKATAIFINHAISTAKAFGKQSEAAGGHGLKFMASVRVEFVAIGNLAEKDERLGQKILLNIAKLKNARNNRPKIKEVHLINGQFDQVQSLLEAGKATGWIDHPKGAKVYTLFKDTEQQIQFAKDEWPDVIGQLGGYEKAYENWVEHGKAAGLIDPWGD